MSLPELRSRRMRTRGLMPITHKAPEVRTCDRCGRIHAFHCGYQYTAQVRIMPAYRPAPEPEYPPVEEWDRLIDASAQAGIRMGVRLTDIQRALMNHLRGELTVREFLPELLAFVEPLPDFELRAEYPVPQSKDTREIYSRVDFEDLDRLQQLADRHGLTRSEALRAALRYADKAGRRW